MSETYLVLMDTDKIKDYVFATGRLREIRGASALLDHLNKTKIEQLAKRKGGSLIYAAGGAALIEFQAKDNAERFVEDVETTYVKETKFATITGVVVEQKPGVGFSDVMKDAAYQLRRKKLMGRHYSNILAQPLFYRCERCGHFTAEYFYQHPSPTYLCEVCSIKQKQLPSHQQPISSTNVLAEQRLRTRAIELGYGWESNNFLRELEDFHNVSTPSNYFGLVYADGNGVGNIIQNRINSADEMKKLSEILDNAVYDSIIQALIDINAIRDEVIPIIPILVGGDDLLVLIASQFAFDFASHLCNNFQTLVKQSSENIINQPNLNHFFGGSHLDASMSAGIVISKISHPIRALEKLAGELLISAKDLSRKIPPQFGNQGTLDFQVIKSPTVNNLSVIREGEYLLDSDRWGTARPYLCQNVSGLNRPSWQDMRDSIELLKISGFPKNKLHEWETLLFLPVHQAQMQIKFLMSRLRTEHKDVMIEISKKLKIKKPQDLFLIDPLQSPVRVSPLPDVEEIYEFVLR